MYDTLIQRDELHTLIGAPGTVIIDCRFSLADTTQGLDSWRSSHLPGAHYAHLDNDLSGTVIASKTGRHPLPERGELAHRFGQWGITADSQIVCYDADLGAMASRFWWLSRWLGHSRCAVLDGGFAAWTQAGLPVDDRQPPCAVTRFLPKEPLVDTLTIDQVAAGGHQLVDAREAVRFRGELEPIDPVAGHIPGATNLPFQGNLGSDGLWLSAAALRARFEPLTCGRPLAHYCGSGVTAAHNLLAMTHAGLTAGALYAGSWSEWINQNDARYQVARQVD